MTDSPDFNPLSQTSYFVQTAFDDTVLSSATAFFVIRGNASFLITNWHVVSGRSPDTNECLSKACAIPNKLVARLHKESDTIEFVNFEIPLLTNEGTPTWLEHPQYGKQVDVVAVPVTLPPHLLAMDVERFIEPMNETTKEMVADDVFILGYPFGLSAGDVFPIWKRATIASEPAIDVSGLPKVLVDTASRSGMSGSPAVLLQRRPIGLIKGTLDDLAHSQISHHRMKLVGVYSGRIGADDTSLRAQLGIVWKSRVIDEIISGQSGHAA